MAATPEGRQLTEEHRLEQQQIRAEFLAEFIALWALLDTENLDETGPGWVRAASRLIASYRLISAEAATRYYWEFRAAEIPDAPPPGVSRETRPQTPPPPAGPNTGRPPRVAPRRASSSARREPGGRRPGGDRIIPEPRNSRVRFDIDEDAVRRSLERPGTRIEIPEIDWRPADRAVRVSLNVTGPVGQKSRIGKGESPQRARDASFVESAGAAGRHVLTGGRRSLLTLLTDDPKVRRWVRVTDGDPCAFCAMLAGRGPVYLTEDSAGFRAHDHCACTAEPVYHANAPWPGRAQEFHNLWRKYIYKRYSGRQAIREWERIYRQLQREGRELEVG